MRLPPNAEADYCLQKQESKQAFLQFLKTNSSPLIIDADALNILSENSEWLNELQPNTILTPHPGELKRLIGEWEDDFDKIERTKHFARKYNLIVVIKGAHSLIIDSDYLYVNSSGTPALATAGSGDVLSGIIAGLLAQGYNPLMQSRVSFSVNRECPSRMLPLFKKKEKWQYQRSN